MTSEQADRMNIGWSREQLAQISGVEVSTIYLIERMGTAGPENDKRVRDALSRRKVEPAKRQHALAANDR